MSLLSFVLAWLGRAALLVIALVAVSATAQPARHIDPVLAFGTRSPAPGQTVTVAIQMRAERGWHGYWSNPGDSGLPPQVKWSAPEGVTFTELRHPAPRLLNVQGIASYVHDGTFTLLATMTVPDDARVGRTIPLKVALDWLACSDTLCVPESAELLAQLQVGSGAIDSAGRAIIDSARQNLPRATDEGWYVRQGSDLLITLPGAADAVTGGGHLFPVSDGWFEAGTSQSIERSGEHAIVRVTGSPDGVSGEFRGVLRTGQRSYAISASQGSAPGLAELGAVPSNQDPAPPPQTGEGKPVVLPTTGLAPTQPVAANEASAPDATQGVFLFAIMGALVGGLILNLMPCVFPILSLKALALAKSGSSVSSARREGIGYTAGSVATSLALGGLLIGLREVGVEIGWSFQLQSPMVILVLVALTSAIALNLAGLFELPTPSFVGAGSRAEGWFGAFSTGALAAVIAMPCSGPFMASALGAALVLPALAALAVFAALGIGMALPFLLIAFVPALQRRLPRPGPWMVTLRRVLAIPMFATALALAWLLGRQVGVDGMALGLAVALAVAGSLWWLGLRQRRGLGGALALLPGAAVLVGVLILGFTEPPASAAVAEPEHGTMREPFSEERLSELRAAGTPVFVDFTADWCLICKVNERVAIDTAKVRKAFENGGVVTLVSDWTRQDPEITRFLAKHGRNSIPFYLFYGAGDEPEILPQLLTADILVSEATTEAALGA